VVPLGAVQHLSRFRVLECFGSILQVRRAGLRRGAPLAVREGGVIHVVDARAAVGPQTDRLACYATMYRACSPLVLSDTVVATARASTSAVAGFFRPPAMSVTTFGLAARQPATVTATWGAAGAGEMRRSLWLWLSDDEQAANAIKLATSIPPKILMTRTIGDPVDHCPCAALITTTSRTHWRKPSSESFPEDRIAAHLRDALEAKGAHRSTARTRSSTGHTVSAEATPFTAT
jgi:hypothetical protein